LNGKGVEPWFINNKKVAVSGSSTKSGLTHCKTKEPILLKLMSNWVWLLIYATTSNAPRFFLIWVCVWFA
jgi:hypothetical protein